MKPLLFALSSMTLGFLLASCNAPVVPKIENPDKAHLRVSPVTQGTDIAPIPALKTNTPYLPKPNLQGIENLYSLSVIQAPIRDVLFKLARDAKLELNVLDEVSGQVTINLIDQPLSVIIERLNEQANIRATLKGKLLTIQSDSAYWVNYPIDYVNLDRFSSSSILLANAVGSSNNTTAAVTLGTPSNQPQPATSLQAGSNVAILNRTKNEVWKTLGDGVMRILRSHYPTLGQAVLEGQTPPAKAPSAAGTASTATTPTSPPTAVTTNESGKLPAPTVLPLPEQALAGNSVNTGPYPEGESVSSYVSLAREAGFIAVYTTRKAHVEVQKYIDSLMNGTRKQVMIEATVVEVSLNDESQAGINWGALTGGFSLTQNYTSSGDLVQRAGTSTLLSNGRVANDWNVSSTLNLLQRFGNSQVLSSPKIVGVNNQPTLLKVVKNLVYFTTTVTPGTTTNGVSTPAVFSTTPNTVPVGLVMSVMPSIDQHDQITLVVRPTISNLVRYIEDPNPEFKKTTLTTPVVSLVPEIQEREMESVLKLNDGQVAILGGLIQDEVVGEDTGVPGLVTQPTFGYLFGQKNTQKRKTELVIFLRPTLVKHPDIDTGDFAPYRELLQKHTTPQAMQR